MASLGDLIVRVGANIADFEASMSTVSARLDTIASEVDRKFSGFSTMGQNLAAAGAGLTAALTLPIAGLGTAAIQAAGAMEQAKVGFTTLLGSGQAATKMLADLQKFAVTTPFNFPELATAAQRLLAMGTNAKDIIPTMTSIGNAVSAMGKGMPEFDRIALAFSQMSNSGKLSAADMRQFTEAGVGAWKYLAKETGISMTEIQEKAKNVLTGSQAAQIILKGMQQDFGGGMEAQSKTLLGMWSNVQDAIKFTLADIGNTMLPLGKALVNDFINPTLEGIKSLAHWFAQLPAPIQNGAIALAAMLAAAGPIALAIGGISLAIGVLAPAITGIAAFIGISTAAFLGWAAAIPLAVAALVALGTWVSSNWASIKAVVAQAWDGITDIWGAAWAGIQSAISSVWGGFLSMATSAWGAVTGFLSYIWDGVGSLWSAAWSTITSGLSTAWSGVEGLASSAWSATTNYFTTLWDSLGPTWSTAWATITGALSTAWGGVSEAASTTWGAVTGFFSTIWDSVSTAFSTAWDGITGILTTAWGTVSSAVATVWNPIASFFSTIWDGIASAWGAVWNGISSVLSSIWNGIKGAAETAWGAVSTAISTFLQWAAKVPGVNKLLNLDDAWNSAKKLAEQTDKATAAVRSNATEVGKATPVHTAHTTATNYLAKAAQDLESAETALAAAYKTIYEPAITNVATAEANLALTRQSVIAAADNVKAAEDRLDSVRKNSPKDADALKRAEADLEQTRKDLKKTTDDYQQAEKDLSAAQNAAKQAKTDIAAAERAYAEAMASLTIPALKSYDQAMSDVAKAQGDVREAMGKLKEDEEAYANFVKTDGIKSETDLQAARDKVKTSTENLKTAVGNLYSAEKDLKESTDVQARANDEWNRAEKELENFIRSNSTPTLKSFKQSLDDVREAKEDCNKASDDLRRAEDELRQAQKTGDLDKVEHATRNLTTARGDLRLKTDKLKTAEGEVEKQWGTSRRSLDDLTTSTNSAKRASEDLEAAMSSLGLTSVSKLQEIADKARDTYNSIASNQAALPKEKDDALIRLLEAERAAMLAAGTDLPADQLAMLNTLKAQEDYFNLQHGQLVQNWSGAWVNAIKDVNNAITNDLSKGISDVIKGAGDIGGAFKKMGEDVVDIIVNHVITEAIKPLLSSLDDVLLKLGNIIGKWLGLGSSAGGVLGTGVGAGSPGTTIPFPQTGGSSGGGIPSGGAGGAVGGAAGGALGMVDVVGTIVTAISSVIGNFQMAHQETSLNAIEHNTRYSMMYLGERADGGIMTASLKLLDAATGILNAINDLVVPTLRELRDAMKAVFTVNVSVPGGSPDADHIISSLITRMGMFDTTQGDRLLDINASVKDVSRDLTGPSGIPSVVDAITTFQNLALPYLHDMADPSLLDRFLSGSGLLGGGVNVGGGAGGGSGLGGGGILDTVVGALGGDRKEGSLNAIELNTRNSALYLGDRADGGILGVLFHLDEHLQAGTLVAAVEDFRNKFWDTLDDTWSKLDAIAANTAGTAQKSPAEQGADSPASASIREVLSKLLEVVSETSVRMLDSLSRIADDLASLVKSSIQARRSGETSQAPAPGPSAAETPSTVVGAIKAAGDGIVSAIHDLGSRVVPTVAPQSQSLGPANGVPWTLAWSNQPPAQSAQEPDPSAADRAIVAAIGEASRMARDGVLRLSDIVSQKLDLIGSVSRGIQDTLAGIAAVMTNTANVFYDFAHKTDDALRMIISDLAQLPDQIAAATAPLPATPRGGDLSSYRAHDATQVVIQNPTILDSRTTDALARRVVDTLRRGSGRI